MRMPSSDLRWLLVPQVGQQGEDRQACSAHRVNAVDDHSDLDVDEPVDGTFQLESELEFLLTQAAKKRAQVEKARGFSKPVTKGPAR